MGNKGKRQVNKSSSPSNTKVDAEKTLRLLVLILAVIGIKRERPKLYNMVNGICSNVGLLLVGLGVPEMIAGHEYAPWVVATGFLLVAVRIILDNRVNDFVTRFIHSAWVRILIYCAVCLLFLTFSFLGSQRYATSQREILAKTPIFYWRITPGSEPMPENFSSYVSSDTPLLMLGDKFAIQGNQSRINVFSHNGTSYLSIGIGADGMVTIGAEILDSNNHNIVRVMNNEFQANPEYAFNPRQPDSHTLIVRDAKGVEVLNIKYMNPKVIRVTGRFKVANSPQPVVIDPDVIHIGNVDIVGIRGVVWHVAADQEINLINFR